MAYDWNDYKSDWVDMIIKKKEFLDNLKKTGWSLDHNPEIKMPCVYTSKNAGTPECTEEMAERIMDALCEDGRGDFLILKDDEIREWWTSILARRRALAAAQAEKERVETIRREALRKLSAEERKILGINDL